MTPEPATASGSAGSGVVASGFGPGSSAPDADAPTFRQVFTTRAGGVSAPPYGSLNLGGGVGDDPAAVLENRVRATALVGLPAAAVVWMNQVHGTRVTTVRSPKTAFRPADSATGDDPQPSCDGVVTAAPGVALGVLVADCVPMLAGDPGAKVIAAVHAGRRGAADGIALRAVEAMIEAGASIGAIQVTLGPAICGACYEVPAAMRDEVEHALPGSASITDRGTPGLDIRAGLVRQLRSAGVGSVVVDPRCTYTDGTLFSHRRGAPTGRFAGLIWLPR